MKKLIFLVIIFSLSILPIRLDALTQIDVETEGNAIEWANTASTNENLGTAMASGDVNGDGIDDLLVGNSQYDTGGTDRGRVYLIYGSANTAASPFNDDTLQNSGITFTGVTAFDKAGTSVALIDINRDGFDDIFIGAPGHSIDPENIPPYGMVYLIYGQSAALSSLSLSDATVKEFEGQESFTDLQNGDVSAHSVGQTIVSAGDMNGDTYEDVAVSTTNHSETPLLISDGDFNGPGAVYIIYGQSTPFGDSGSFDSFDVKFNGITNEDETGASLAGAENIGFTDTDDDDIDDVGEYGVGDIDDDGFDDLIIGATQGASSGTGKTYIIYGQNFTPGTTINLSTRPQLTGESISDRAGSAVTLTNLNNDAYTDIIVGANLNDDGLNTAGSIYVIYGSSSRISGTHSLSEYVQITGAEAFTNLGATLAGGRDLNNDSIEDFVIGAPANSAGGDAFILFGSNSQETSGSITDKADILLNSLAGNHQNSFGGSFALGDFNGDGSPQFSDIAIGAPGTGPNKGAVYTFFQRFDSDDDGYDADQNYVLFSGNDCNDGNIAIHTNYTFYQDADTDNSGSGTMQVLCQGASPSAPGGYRTSVANTTDCNDSDATVSANQTYYLDADGDTIGTGTTESICSATPSSGYRISVAGSTDCNDSDASIVINQTYYEDQDSDGVGSGNSELICALTPSSGYRTSVSGSSDCNDSDAAVSSNQTYYLDADDDGLGSDTTESFCSATAPDGYATNSNDTNDTIVNNGVEISGDGIDNDSDGSADEVNTISGNGPHPGYKNLSVTSSDDYKDAIQSVSARTNGKVRVTFKDGSIYEYKVFTTSTSKKTLYKIIKSTGRIVVVSENGKQIRTVNLFSGAVLDTKTGIKSKTKFNKHSLIVQDIRSDGSLELLVTSSDTKKRAYVTLVRITKKTTLSVKARKEVSDVKVDVKKTKIKGATIQLRNTKRTVLRTYKINNLYELISPK